MAAAPRVDRAKGAPNGDVTHRRTGAQDGDDRHSRIGGDASRADRESP
jgi:hypothetical protein